jgi:hypothetical protein
VKKISCLTTKNRGVVMDDQDFEESDHDLATMDAERVVFDDRFKPLSFSDFKLSPPPWLLGSTSPMDDGFIRSRTITMLSAEPFTGKTMLMLGITLGLASGLPVLGYPPQGRQRVLFMGQDAPTWDYFGQAVKLWLGLGSPAIPNPPLFFLNKGWQLTDPLFSSFITDCVRVHGTTVLMLDTLLSFHSAEENSNKEMAVVMNLLKSLRDKLSLTIIFSHHTSKAPGNSGTYSARGASVISGSVDFHLSLFARGSAVSLGLPKRRGSQKRGASGFSILDTPSGGIILEPRTATIGPSALLLSFLAVPRTEAEILAYLSEHYGDTDPEVTRGRWFGTLGVIKKRYAVLQPAPGTFQVSGKPFRSAETKGASND